MGLCLVMLTMQLLRLVFRFTSEPEKCKASVSEINCVRPVFSVHVAIHNEPPAVVTRTLRSLAAQQYPGQFEIIVIDNNTADPALWRPIEAVCAALGPRFRFFHRMKVVGAKAGALNIALSQTRPDATHIVTVDADYVTQPAFLSKAASALARTGADYVQFPQAYIRRDAIAGGVEMELEEYFRTDARMADGAEAVLLTGTLCVISRAALLDVGGWSGRTTTEDAELGLRLCCAGYRGRYIDDVVGKGLLPLALADLAAQRHRWASGNLRTLICHVPALAFCGGGLVWRQRRAMVAQLTAWQNFSLIPVAVLLSCLIWAPQGAQGLARLAAMSILLTLLDILLRLGARSAHDGRSLRAVLGGFAARIALSPASARATLDALLPTRLQFKVTAKDSRSASHEIAVPTDHLILFLLASLAVPGVAEAGWLVQLGWLSLLLPLPAALLTDMELAQYRGQLPLQEVSA